MASTVPATTNVLVLETILEVDSISFSFQSPIVSNPGGRGLKIRQLFTRNGIYYRPVEPDF
jgi:hypothetical protein